MLDFLNKYKDSNKIAIVCGNDKITYKELYEKACFYSKFLEGDNRPVIVYETSLNSLISIVSLLFIRRTYIPVDVKTPLKRLNEIIKSTKASLIISDLEITGVDIEVKSLKNIDSIKNVKKNIDKKNIFKETAYIISTSGTTGSPKLIPITYDNLCNFVNWISNISVLKDFENINVLNTSSFSFDLSVASIYYSLCNENCLHINIFLDFSKWFELVVKEKINLIVATPTFIKMCLLDKNFNEKNFKSLKCIYFCGEMLDSQIVKKLQERFSNISIINAYGPTEATCSVCASIITDSTDIAAGNVTSSCVKIEIQNGEIILKGKSVFNGYIGKKSTKVYKKNNINCFKTGDLGYIENNKLYVKDRIDRQIKYKGYRIELADIEKNINEIDGVLSSAVIAKKNEKGYVKTIKAFVQTNNCIDEEYIKGKLKEKICDYMIPSIIEIKEKLPVNKNGKLDRKALENYD